MPAAPLPEELEQFVSRPNPCVMATVRPDGSPVSVACWYDYVDGFVTLSMEPKAHRLGHLRSNPKLALTILGEDWYQHVSLLCHVVEIRDDESLEDIDRLSIRYVGEPYPEREPCVTVLAAIDRWHTYGSPS